MGRSKTINARKSIKFMYNSLTIGFAYGAGQIPLTVSSLRFRVSLKPVSADYLQ